MNIRRYDSQRATKKVNNDKDKDSNKKQGGFSVGTSLVLVTFVLIALVSFATISYVEARSDKKLTTEALDRTEAYYQADAIAQEKIAKINDLLRDERQGQISDDDYYESVRAVLGEDYYVTMDNMSMETKLYISFAEKIDEKSQIKVKLLINSLDEEKVSEIKAYKTENINDNTEEEEPLHLIF